MKTRIQLTYRVNNIFKSKKTLDLKDRTGWTIHEVNGNTILETILPFVDEMKRRKDVANKESVYIQIVEYNQDKKKSIGRSVNSNLQTVSSLLGYLFAINFNIGVSQLPRFQRFYKNWKEDKQIVSTPIHFDLCDRQYNKEVHGGYFIITHGEFYIVRSVHESEDSAIMSMKEKDSIINPNGESYIPNLLMDKSEAHKALDIVSANYHLFSDDSKEIIKAAVNVLDEKEKRFVLIEMLEISSDIHNAVVMMVNVFFNEKTLDDVQNAIEQLFEANSLCEMR